MKAGARVILATLTVALVLNVLPRPPWADPLIPDWVALTLIYWCLATPERVSVGTGWILGIIMDVLYGSLLGQHALAKTVIAFLCVKLYPKLRMFPPWQQAMSVLVLLVIDQLIVLWIRGATGQAPGTIAYWMPSIVGMALWPWWYLLLSDLQRRARIIEHA